jgi:hypothetical protein
MRWATNAKQPLKIEVLLKPLGQTEWGVGGGGDGGGDGGRGGGLGGVGGGDGGDGGGGTGGGKFTYTMGAADIGK